MSLGNYFTNVLQRVSDDQDSQFLAGKWQHGKVQRWNYLSMSCSEGSVEEQGVWCLAESRGQRRFKGKARGFSTLGETKGAGKYRPRPAEA